MPVGPLSRYTGLSALQVDHETRGPTLSLPVRRAGAERASPERLHLFTGSDAADILAGRFLGSEVLYWRILDANSGRLPDEFEPGDLVVVPDVGEATRVRR